MCLKYIIICVNIIIVYCIWPPPYKINLKYSEEFTIGEAPDIETEDEMIPSYKIVKFHLEKDQPKFERLHKQSKRFNDKINDIYENNFNNTGETEEYYDSRELEPLEFGFLNTNNSFIKDQVKREENTDKVEKDYNYEELDKEYQLKINEQSQNNNTFQLKDEDESLQKELEELVDFQSSPRNCTAEELRGIGYKAVKCVWLDLKKVKTKENLGELLRRLSRIVIIWFLIYATVALPCWCHKGWCCCCFRCKFCKPRERINEAKKYFMDNPPGVFLKSDGEIITYEPNKYELYAYEKLDRALMNL